MRQFWRLERRPPAFDGQTELAAAATTHNRRFEHFVGAENTMKNLFVRFVREEEGQDIIEYALLAAFISIVAWLILREIGQDVQTMYSNVQKATGDAAS